MAESSTKAFGRYLKTLRERRGLSLDDVTSLSQTFPEKINKGYLSRCENGHQKLAFAKVIALSRIFEVPADVLVERMELDLELDRVGGPETGKMTYAELTDAGKKALEKGFYWRAYGYLRDAVPLASEATLKPVFSTREEQIDATAMNFGTAVRSLGRHRLALHEFLFLESRKTLGPQLHALLLERISRSHCALGNLDLAEKYATQSIQQATAADDHQYIGYLFFNRARIASHRGNHQLAASLHQKAFRAHKAVGRPVECTQIMNCLAQCYLDLRRHRAARRAAETSERLSRSHQHYRSLAFSLVTLGELDEIESKPTQALRRWREALEIAKRLSDKELRFKIEFMLYSRALRDGDVAVARAIRRRLNRLAPWMAPETEELIAFKQLISQDMAPM